MNEATGFRHELKFLCSDACLRHLSEALSAVLETDEHQKGLSYHIRSLYFDTSDDRFLCESLDGQRKRFKYRIRGYDTEKDKLKLEKKVSLDGLKRKKFVWINENQARALSGDKVSVFEGDALLTEIGCLKNTEGLSPKIVIDYDRTAFAEKFLNIRVTLDTHITASADGRAFFSNARDGLPVLPGKKGILEVKFDTVLPAYLVSILRMEDLRQTSFSKYVNGRLTCKNQSFEMI